VKVDARAAPGESIEAAARSARYAALGSHLASGEILLTGHHENDQLETVLLQLFRGSGLAGVAAMPELTRFADGWLCRPLLTTSREKIAQWATAEHLEWIEDDSNSNEDFDRNYLRRQVLPLIRQRWPGVGIAVARGARHAAEAQHLLEALAFRDAQTAADGFALQAAALRALPMDRRRNVLRFWIASSGAVVPDTRRLDEIAGPLLNARPDSRPRVCWGEVCVQRESGRLAIVTAAGPVDAKGDCADLHWNWRSAAICELPGGRGKLELRPDPRGPLDLATLPVCVRVSLRRGGERLRLRSGGPTRALKNLLQEAHVPMLERRRLPLLFSGERLLAAGDLWCDESVCARDSSSRRGRLFWWR
jgi:tRNA(Ile)-lysidine synthase